MHPLKLARPLNIMHEKQQDLVLNFELMTPYLSTHNKMSRQVSKKTGLYAGL